MASTNILCMLVVLLSVISGRYSTPCKTHKDIFFLLDESGSINSNDFSKMKEFMIDIIENVTMGTEMTHFGVMPFSERYNTDTTIKLTDFYDKQALIKKIKVLQQKGGGTDISKAFSAVREYMGSDYSGRHVKKIVILITDGWSDTKTAIEEAENCKRDGITIYAIGIGRSTDENLLKSVSSKPQTKAVNYWQLDNTNTLFDVRFKLTDSVCDLKESKCIPNCLECPEDNLSICNPKKCAMGYAEEHNGTACSNCAENCLRCLDAGPGKCDEGYCRKSYNYISSSKICEAPKCNEDNCLDCAQNEKVCQKCEKGYTYDHIGIHTLRSGARCRRCAENCQKCDKNFFGKCDSDGCEVGYDYDSFTGTCKEIPCKTIKNCVKCANNSVCDECRPPLQPTQHGTCEIDRSSCKIEQIYDSTVSKAYDYESLGASGLFRSSRMINGLDCRNAPNCNLIRDLNIDECRDDSSTYLMAVEVYLENVHDFYAKLDNLTFLNKSVIDQRFGTVNKTFTEQLAGNNFEMKVEFRSYDTKYKLSVDICCERKCDEGCENCTHGSCSKCRKGYVLKNDQCNACGENCMECDTNEPNKCLECKIGYGFVEGTTVCKPCAPHCYKCQNATRCDKNQCRVGYALAGDNSCKPCAPHCLQCSENGPGKCDSGKCHVKYFYDTLDNVCRETKCETKELAHCLNCEENPKVCRVCENPYIPNPVTGECYLTSALCGEEEKEAIRSFTCPSKKNCDYYADFDCGGRVPFMKDVNFFHNIAPYKPSFTVTLDGQPLVYTKWVQSNGTLEEEPSYKNKYQVNTRGANIRVQFNNTGDRDINAKVRGVGCCIETIGYTDCKITTAGREYIGTVHTTAGGLPCQRWSDDSPVTHHMKTNLGVQFPDGSDVAAKNYCRNPTDNRPDGPWCYIATDDEKKTKKWDYCKIKFCEEGKQEKRKKTT